MLSSKIEENQIQNLKVASLPTRPTAPASLGGKGYTSVQMKEPFDRLPLYIIERFNALYDDICAPRKDSIANLINTGILEGHTLGQLFDDITNGTLLAYIQFFDTSLLEFLINLKDDVELLKGAL